MDRVRLLDRLSAVQGIRLAYLFGSRATGTAGPRSDADVGVIFDPPLGPRDLSILQEALSDAAGAEVDLVDLRSAPPLLRYEAISRGQRLLVRDDGERTAFEARAMLDYMDTQHLRDVQHYYLRERARAGGA